MPISLRLPNDVEARLSALSALTGRSKSFYAIEAIVEHIDDLAGLGRTNPFMAFVFAMLLFSLAGIPPLAGFFAKWYVFAAAVEAKLITLAVIGVITSVIGTYYYHRLVKIMYFDEPKGAFEPASLSVRTVVAASGAFVFLFWLWPAPLVKAAGAAAKSLF